MKTMHYLPNVWNVSHCFQTILRYRPRKGAARVGQSRCAVVTEFCRAGKGHVWKMFGTLVAPAFRNRPATPLIKSHKAVPEITEVIPTILGVFTPNRDWALQKESE